MCMKGYSVERSGGGLKSERMWAPYTSTGVVDSSEAGNETTGFFENRRSQGASEPPFTHR